MLKSLNKQAQEIVLKINKAKTQEQFDAIIEECRNLNKCEAQIDELLKIAYNLKHKVTTKN